jgi:DNA-binding transcriptional regulator YiaG
MMIESRLKIEVPEWTSPVIKMKAHPLSGEEFLSIRNELGLSQRQLSHLLSMTIRSISLMETGRQPVRQMTCVALLHLALLFSSQKAPWGTTALLDRENPDELQGVR